MFPFDDLIMFYYTDYIVLVLSSSFLALQIQLFSFYTSQGTKYDFIIK